MVEAGLLSGLEVEASVREALAPLLGERDASGEFVFPLPPSAKVDTLLLGCTHYPFLARTIGDVMGRDVVLVSSADETAFEVLSILDETGTVRRSGSGAGKGRHHFISSGDVGWFKELGAQLLGPELGWVEAWTWS